MNEPLVAELAYGAANSQHQQQNRAALDLLLASLVAVAFVQRVARHAGKIRAYLTRTGTSTGGCDVLIAGHARSLNVTLVTNNMSEFSRVPHLPVENWVQ